MTVFSTKTPATLLVSLVMFATGVMFAASVTAQQVVLDDVPYNTPMWSQADPFGFAELRGLTNTVSELGSLTNTVAYGPRITALEAQTNLLNTVASYGNHATMGYLKNNSVNSVDYNSFSISNQSYDQYGVTRRLFTVSPSQGVVIGTEAAMVQSLVNLGKAGLTVQRLDTYGFYSVVYGMYSITISTPEGAYRTYDLPEGGDSRLATMHDVGSAVDGLATTAYVNSATGAITAASLGALTSAPPQSVVSVNSKTGTVVLTAADVGAATTQDLAAYLPVRPENPGELDTNTSISWAPLFDGGETHGLKINGIEGSAIIDFEGIRLHDGILRIETFAGVVLDGTQYHWPSGPSSTIATLHDITNAIDQIDVEEHDPRAMNLYHYGDPDIHPSPTNWFSFTSVDGGAAWAVSGFDYVTGREDVVVPYEFYGKPVTEVGFYAFSPGGEGFNITTVVTSARKIRNGAMESCFSLRNVTALLCEEFGDGAFEMCGSLTNIIVAASNVMWGPNALTSINPYGVITVTNPKATGWPTEIDGTPVVRPALHTDKLVLGGVEYTEISTGGGGAVEWQGVTNTSAAVTIATTGNPIYWQGAGNPTLTLTGLVPGMPIYLVCQGMTSLQIADGYLVGGGEFQAGRANHYLVWRYGAEVLVTGITTTAEGTP